MELTRRNLLVIGSGAIAFGSLPAMPALASTTDEAIAKLTGGADIGEGGLNIVAPEIAENGNTVPISITAPGARLLPRPDTTSSCGRFRSRTTAIGSSTT